MYENYEPPTSLIPAPKGTTWNLTEEYDNINLKLWYSARTLRESGGFPTSSSIDITFATKESFCMLSRKEQEEAIVRAQKSILNEYEGILAGELAIANWNQYLNSKDGK